MHYEVHVPASENTTCKKSSDAESRLVHTAAPTVLLLLKRYLYCVKYAVSLHAYNDPLAVSENASMSRILLRFLGMLE